MMDDEPSRRSSSDTRQALTVALVKPGRGACWNHAINSFSAMLYTRFVIGDDTLSSTRDFNFSHCAIFSIAINSFIFGPDVGHYRPPEHYLGSADTSSQIMEQKGRFAKCLRSLGQGAGEAPAAQSDGARCANRCDSFAPISSHTAITLSSTAKTRWSSKRSSTMPASHSSMRQMARPASRLISSVRTGSPKPLLT